MRQLKQLGLGKWEMYEMRMKEVMVERLRKCVLSNICVRSRGIDEEMERTNRIEDELKKLR